jgi:hypothetical protein
MPKYAVHHIVLNDAIGQLLASPDASAAAAGNELAANMPASNLGAIGPDLFFWSPDYAIVEKLYTFYKNYKELKALYDSVVQPIRDIRDAVVEPVEDAVETLAPTTVALIKQLIEEMKETTELFSKTVQTGLFAGVIEGVNLITNAAGFPSVAALLFDYFKPPLQDGRRENCWYWFDMLHYRRTGDFGRQLVQNASGRPPHVQAYASAYLSHIATDLLGHPYVNQVSGGPFRLQVQRHVTSENWMDTWKFQQYYGQNINLELFGKLGLPSTLDPAIGDLLDKTLHDVYENVDHPRRLPGDGFLTRTQIDETYEIFFEVLQLMRDQSVARPEEPFSGVADILESALEDLFQSPPSPPSSPSGSCSLGDILSFGLTSSSQDCYEEFFEQLEDWFEYLGELLAWALETLLDIFDLLLSLLLLLPVAVLLAILYALQLLLYEIWQLVRSTLALTGFVYPEPSDLNDAHGRNLVSPFLCGIQGCRAATASMMAAAATGGVPLVYPRLTNLAVSHLVCPNPVPELPITVPNHAPPGAQTTPDIFINQTPFNLKILGLYARSPSPAQTRSFAAQCLRIGNATDLTAHMIAIARDPASSGAELEVAHANWNLDADRGYGYKTWVGSLPFSGSPVIDEYVGARSTPGGDAKCPDV